MRVGSVCSGIGAPECAWQGLGWHSVFASEIAAFPRAVFGHRFPSVPIHGDFTTIEADTYGPIDLLVGGTPCQSFSVAGLRGGMADERGNLALEFLRLADRLNPRWVVWENVPGVLSSNSGRDFGSFLGGLGQLGYGFAYRVLDAQHFGVAQRRRRVFVVGYLGDWRRAAAVLFERASLCGHPAPRREAGKDVAPTISARPSGGGALGTDFDLDGGLRVARCLTTREGQHLDPSIETYVTGTLCGNGKAAGSATQQDAEAGLLITHTLRGDGFDASEDGTGRGTPLVPVSFDLAQITSAANRTRCEAGLPSSTLAKASRTHVAGFQASQSGMRQVETHATLDANNGSRRHNGALIGSTVRRLTPMECERLQGFPDDWTAVPYRGKRAADGPRYKAIGNSMAVPVLRWIGERVARVDALSSVEQAA